VPSMWKPGGGGALWEVVLGGFLVGEKGGMMAYLRFVALGESVMLPLMVRERGGRVVAGRLRTCADSWHSRIAR